MTLRENTIRLAYASQNPLLREHLTSLVAATTKTALGINEMKKLLAMGAQFAILSPYIGLRPNSENKDRFSDFMRDLQKLGYGNDFDELNGHWKYTVTVPEIVRGKMREVGEELDIPEKSVLVQGMTFQDAYALGRKYKQDSIIYKDPSGTIGFYYPGDNTAVVAVKPTGEIAVRLSEKRDELYSKNRGVSFEFDVLWGQKVPWSGTHPITLTDMTKIIEDGVLRF